jgi:hypothetical protein
MVMFAIFLGCINGGLDNAVGHANAQNGQRIPETAHKNRMPHVPDPFKIKRKHLLSSCPLYASAGFNSCSGAIDGSIAIVSFVSGSMGFNSASLGNTGR